MKTFKSERRAQRNYHGNPLEYYLSHPEEFRGFKTKSELAEGDSGMHQALIRYGQIQEAFPESDPKRVESGRKGGKIGGKKRFNQGQLSEILGDYVTFGGNALEASRNRPYSVNSYLNIWRKAGYKIRKRGQQELSVEDQKRIKKAYKPCHGYASKAKEVLHFDTDTIIKYWRRFGFKTRKRGRPRKEESQDLEQ